MIPYIIILNGEGFIYRALTGWYADKFLVIRIPRGCHDTEENEVGRSYIPDMLDRLRGDQDDLPGPDFFGFSIDVHLPRAAQDIIQFGRRDQPVGKRRLPGRHDCMGDAASDGTGTRDFIRMEKFAEDRPVKDAPVRAGTAVTDEHHGS